MIKQIILTAAFLWNALLQAQTENALSKVFEYDAYKNSHSLLDPADMMCQRYWLELPLEGPMVIDSVQHDSLMRISSAWPVPAVDYVVIEWISDQVWVDIEIFDQYGRLVLSARTKEKIHRIDRAGWAAGQYTYHLSSGSEWIDSGKIIFQ